MFFHHLDDVSPHDVETAIRNRADASDDSDASARLDAMLDRTWWPGVMFTTGMFPALRGVSQDDAADADDAAEIVEVHPLIGRLLAPLLLDPEGFISAEDEECFRLGLEVREVRAPAEIAQQIRF
jgi:hypothetical protein